MSETPAVGSKIKALNTRDLEFLNNDAIRNKRNRTIDPFAFQNIDPEGVHTVWMEVPHRDGAEMRLFLHVKLTGIDGPANAELDVTWEQWRGISTVEKQADGEWRKVIAGA